MSETHLKKFLFKAARTNKLEIFNQFVEDIGGSVPSLLESITKKDPEGRNFVVLCLLFASHDILSAMYNFVHENSEIN